ncbi:MAG TPA: electron transporter RnfD, partial [Syntrophaceae bacterium]|nr:electron transporter RnfD [Syntrophaceae bacterium]
MDENKKLTLSISPHIRDSVSIPKIMYSVIGALCPAWIAAIYFFGPRAAWLALLSIAAAVLTEWIIQKLRKVPISVGDGSAILTGMLLAFNLPPGVSWWIPVVGSGFAIGIGKQVFGGLGYNPMNPALLGRAFLLASWPVQMTTKWLAPRGGTLSGIDGVSS